MYVSPSAATVGRGNRTFESIENIDFYTHAILKIFLLFKCWKNTSTQGGKQTVNLGSVFCVCQRWFYVYVFVCVCMRVSLLTLLLHLNNPHISVYSTYQCWPPQHAFIAIFSMPYSHIGRTHTCMRTHMPARAYTHTHKHNAQTYQIISLHGDLPFVVLLPGVLTPDRSPFPRLLVPSARHALALQTGIISKHLRPPGSNSTISPLTKRNTTVPHL